MSDENTQDTNAAPMGEEATVAQAAPATDAPATDAPASTEGEASAAAPAEGEEKAA